MFPLRVLLRLTCTGAGRFSPEGFVRPASLFNCELAFSSTAQSRAGSSLKKRGSASSAEVVKTQPVVSDASSSEAAESQSGEDSTVLVNVQRLKAERLKNLAVDALAKKRFRDYLESRRHEGAVHALYDGPLWYKCWRRKKRPGARG